MQLFVLILKKTEFMDEIIRQLAASGIKGGTILEGTGMARALVNMEELPIFSMLKYLLVDPENTNCKLMLIVLKEEQVITTKETIKKVIGDLNAPNSGIIFTLPVTYVEGIGA
jgi:nitrogen regulatory protein PII